MEIRISIIGFIFLLSCISGCESSPKEFNHPDSSQFPAEHIIDYSVDLADDVQERLPTLYNSDSLQKIGEIGRDSLHSDRYYGNSPREIAIDFNDNIYIIQEQTNSINVYDRSGTFKYNIGRWGKGPGEFLEIKTFDFGGDFKKLYVLDRFKIEIFKRKDDKYIPADRILIPEYHQLYDLCVLNQDLFISGFKVDASQLDSLKNLPDREQQEAGFSKLEISKPISRFNLQASQFEVDFGYIYKTHSGFGPYNGMLSHTMLSCNETTNTVVGRLYYFPYLFGYDPRGDVKWRSKIENYTSIQTTEKITKERGPVLSRYSNEGIYNRYFPSRNINSGKYDLVQIRYRISDKPYVTSLPDPNYKTMLIDTGTGELFLSESYEIFWVQKNDMVLTMDGDSGTDDYTFDIYKYQ